MVFLGPGYLVHVLGSPYIILNILMFRVEGVFGLYVLSATRRLDSRMISIHIIIFPEIKQKKIDFYYKIYEVSHHRDYGSLMNIFNVSMTNIFNG